MEFEQLLKALSEHIGGEAFTPDADGVLALSVDDMSVRIANHPSEGTVSFVGVVGSPPSAERAERLYRALLEANYLFAGTGGAVFSSDAETGDIVLAHAFALRSLDGEAFCRALTAFVNTLESWMRLLTEYSNAPAEELASPGPGMMSV